MSTSNSRKEKYIKIGFLGLFLLTFIISPFLTHAQLMEKWYYAARSFSTGQTYSNPFNTKDQCEADREKNKFLYLSTSICKNLNKDLSEVSVLDFEESDFTDTTPIVPTNPSAPIPYAPQTPAQNINQPAAQDQEKNYYPLQNLPGLGDVVQLAPNCVIDPVTKLADCTPAKGFGDYLNILIRLFIGICAVLAMIMIVMGGIQYMTSELISSKQAAKQTITNAILGLLLALAAFAILFTLNPKLTDIGLQNIETANVVVISPEDTSTGSDTSLCLDSTSALSPDDVTISTVNIDSYPSIKNEYIPIRDMAVPGISGGARTLITAQAIHEGFFPTSLSYITNNPGNIGNTDSGGRGYYDTLGEGIKAQYNLLVKVAGGNTGSYIIGSKYDCALGGEIYDGSLYQYLRIYATGARRANSYLSFIISFFKSPVGGGLTITPRTKMSEILNMGGPGPSASGPSVGVLNSVTFNNDHRFVFKIGGYDNSIAYTYSVYSGSPAKIVSESFRNKKIYKDLLTGEDLDTSGLYSKIKGLSVDVVVYGATTIRVGQINNIQIP